MTEGICPFDINGKGSVPFEVEDAFNPGNTLSGHLFRDPDLRYGMLYIEKVNNKKCPQVVWATPKLHYPFDKEGTFKYQKDIDKIEVYEKLDGTNILAYSYIDKECNQYVTYKTRLTPMVRDGSFGTFATMWKEMLDRYPNISEMVLKTGHNLSFEMFGKRNKHLIEYDNSLDAVFLFGRDMNGTIKSPTSFDNNKYGILAASLITTFEGDFNFIERYQEIVDYLNERIKVEIRELENDLVYGLEGSVWYGLKEDGSILYKCLDGRTLVKTPNGSMRLSEIVGTEYNGNVLSYDTRIKRIISKRVVGWHRLRNDESCFKLVRKHGDTIRILIGNESHPILTKRGYIKIGELMDDDIICTGDYEPNYEQREMILGCVLGDATIYSAGNIRFNHSKKHEDYLKVKIENLSNLASQVKETFVMLDSNKHQVVYAGTKVTEYFKNLRKEFYKDGVKIIPKWLDLTPILLAYWFMDDGYLDKKELGSIATNSFKKEDVEFLAESFIDMGIQVDIRSYPSSFKGYKIYLNKENMFKLGRLIAPYIPECMSYKLPKVLREETKIQINRMPILKWSRFEKEEVKKKSYLYCIDVEDTHNFLTSFGVVHNCKPDYVRDVHFAISEGIPHHSILITCINAFEDRDNPDLDYIVELLKEEFSETDIQRKILKISKILKEVRMNFELKSRLRKEYLKYPEFDIKVDKGIVMRHFGSLYPKKMMSRVYNCLIEEFGES